ncbi:NAD-dependent epimerase/dehydratase family protein [Flindersiella endophytica]
MRVLITGAAGGVAGLLLPGLREHHDVRETDLRGPHAGDLTDPAFAASVVEGMDAVVHLAASANPEATWDELYEPNVIAAATVLEAAADAGVSKVVLASSGHAMGQYVRPGALVSPALPPAPCCPYGATKAFVEAAGRVAAYRHGIQVVVLRLGAVYPVPPALEAMPAWLAPDDLRRLVERALEADVRFTVCHGMSANQPAQWDLANDIGYRPTNDSSRYGDVPDLPGWGVCPGAGLPR